MEAVMMHGSLDQSTSPYNKSHLKNRKITRQNSIISNPADVFWPTGLLQPPPPPFHSQPYPSYALQKSPQPPLLPLPVATPQRSAAARGLSYQKGSQPIKTRDLSFTPKKSKSPKKVERNSPRKATIESDAGKFKNGSSSSMVGGDEMDVFSGPVLLTISPPPPSSLPLPTFSLRPKLGCKAAAGGINACATDDLRRLLRLP